MLGSALLPFGDSAEYSCPTLFASLPSSVNASSPDVALSVDLRALYND